MLYNVISSVASSTLLRNAKGVDRKRVVPISELKKPKRVGNFRNP